MAACEENGRTGCRKHTGFFFFKEEKTSTELEERERRQQNHHQKQPTCIHICVYIVYATGNRIKRGKAWYYTKCGDKNEAVLRIIVPSWGENIFEARVKT